MTVADDVTNAPAVAQIYIEAQIAIALDKYAGGAVLFCGVIFNFLSIVLLRRKRMRGTTTSLYLVALAATDLAQVFTGQATRHWVRALTGSDPPAMHTWYCKIWFYLIRVFNSYSNWVLASVSTERCIAIMFPLHAKSIITKKSAKIFLSLALLFFLVYYCHSIVSYKTITQHVGDLQVSACVTNMGNYFSANVRPWADFVLEMLLPGILIVICNTIIIVTLSKARQKRAKSLAGGQTADDQMNSMVVMLVSVSIAYLLLTTPMHVNFVLSSTYPAGYTYSGRAQAVNRLVWAVSLFLHYINHSINFLLYVISGREFRSELKALFMEIFCAAKLKEQKMQAQKKLQVANQKTITSSGNGNGSEAQQGSSLSSQSTADVNPSVP